jgi:hypothetical protein
MLTAKNFLHIDVAQLKRIVFATQTALGLAENAFSIADPGFLKGAHGTDSIGPVLPEKITRPIRDATMQVLWINLFTLGRESD